MAALLALLLLLPPTGPAAASPGGDPPGTPEVPPGPPEPPQDLLDAAYQARCAAPPAPGPCRASFQRWFHSPGGGGGCRPFTYGGCGGNANNYARRQDCERSCQRHAPGTEPAVQPTIALALLLLPLLLLLGGVAAALARRRFSGCAPPGLGRSPPAPDKEALVGAVGPL